MTASLRPTAVRLALLQAVADGEVTMTSLWRVQWRPATGTQQDVSRRVGAMEANGLVKVGPALGPLASSPHPIELTAAGRQILDQHKETT